MPCRERHEPSSLRLTVTLLIGRAKHINLNRLVNTCTIGQSALRDKLLALVRKETLAGCSLISAKTPSSQSLEPVWGFPPLNYDQPVNVVVTPNEINNLHGTGPIIKRLMRGRKNILSIRVRSDWSVHDFGNWQISLEPTPKGRWQAFYRILLGLQGQKVDSVLSVPFLAEELYTALALRHCFNAKLACYIMDDQNVAVNNIPDLLMREYLEHCNLRLVTHPELRSAYEGKYQLPFHVLPAVVPNELIPLEGLRAEQHVARTRVALIGSFWDQSWFDCVCDVFTGSGWTVDWYGNHKSPWLNMPTDKIKQAGINTLGVVPETQLAQELSKYPVVIVPAARLHPSESNLGVARLSLPGRILFAVATSQTPVLVLGSKETCAAKFVSHFDVGAVCDYEKGEVFSTIKRLMRADIQKRMRNNAGILAPKLSDRDLPNWFERSVSLGVPADQRFESLFSDYQEKSISQV